MQRYINLINQIETGGPIYSWSNQIPAFKNPNNRYNWTYDIYRYYNEYYASPKTTQDRRLRRNLNLNNADIALSNKNPFINNRGLKFYFSYPYETYMYVEHQPQGNKKRINQYIKINSCWCHQKTYMVSKDCVLFNNKWINKFDTLISNIVNNNIPENADVNKLIYENLDKLQDPNALLDFRRENYESYIQ